MRKHDKSSVMAFFRQKKPSASAQVGEILVVILSGDFTYQYLWDQQSNNPGGAFSSEHWQQPIAKCK